MTWTYLGQPGTGDATQRRDAVRFLAKDTISTRQLIQDEEIDFLLDQNNDNVWRSAADACRKLSAGEAKSKSVGDLSLSGTGDTYMALAREYDMNADSALTPFAGGISVADKLNREQDTDRTPPFFTRALQVNPESPSSVSSSTGST